MGRIISPKTQARALGARQRQARVIALLGEGYSQRKVARRVGVTQARVSQIRRGVLQRLEKESVNELARFRARQLAEIESMRAVTFFPAVGATVNADGRVSFGEPDFGAIDRMLRLQAREAALLGLDADDQPAALGTALEAPGGECEYDLTLLSLEELRQLEALYLEARQRPSASGG